MRNLAQRIAELSPEKRKLFLQQLSKTKQDTSQPSIHSQKREAPFYPLSFAQQRLWFLDLLEPASSIYTIAMPARLKGKLHVRALESSLNEIIRRHEILRTTFNEVEGQIMQVVEPAGAFHLRHVDLQGLATEEREVVAQQLAAEEEQRPFDLAQGPLLRNMFLHLCEDEHILLLTIHHIITDGWSSGVFVRELTTLYTAYNTGKPPTLPSLPIQYGDYAVWQREWLQGHVLDDHLNYWRKQLAGIVPLDLPSDRPRPPVQTFRGAYQDAIVPPSLSNALLHLSQREGVTLFMTLVAAFKTLLFRYSGETDIALGTPIANRNRVEIENLIGFFVNTLVLRTDLAGNPSFQQLLHRVREVALASYTYQDLPFERLVEVLQPERDLSRSPLFQVLFSLQNVSEVNEKLGDITLSTLESVNTITKFDLSITMTESEQGLHYLVGYNLDLFDETTITRMLKHWHVLLEGIVAHPEYCLAELPLLSQDERQQILVDWNSTQRQSPREMCLQTLFELQADRTPDSVALAWGDTCLTYQSLNQRANQLAHYLRSIHIKAGSFVGICMERSLEYVVSILGVLKAGAAYVPLDTHHPQDRFSFILDDTQLQVLLTQEQVLQGLPSHAVPSVCLDRAWDILARERTSNPINITSPENLAYVIYTSGSTGKPKGVLVAHKNVVHSTFARFQYYTEPVSCYLLVSPFTFDSSIAGTFWTLCQGGRLLLLAENFQQDLLHLPAFIAQQHVSHLLSVPSLYALILAQAKPGQLSGLRTIIVAGEPCSMTLAQHHSELLPHTAFYNEYGPTEATVWSSVCMHRFPSERMQLPIGQPIANVQMYLLGQSMQPVPIGVPGEIYIGGTGIAYGYLNQPTLTAEKFIPHPFSDIPGARLYKTGDLARYLPDGKIEFIGRLDHQVKIRGYRVELGEIEAALNQHPAVHESVVLAREDEQETQKLVAFVVQKTHNEGEDEPLPDLTSETEYVAQFQTVYDQLYEQDQAFSKQDTAINSNVWTSSYTNQPLSEEEVLESVDDTVQRVLSLQPERVLEIGCGTGLLLFRIAPFCASYCGVDISEVALQHLRDQLAARDAKLANVSLHHAAAHNLAKLYGEQELFDTVILNEVVQHFPDTAYLERVLQSVIQLVKPGGSIFIGGLRSLSLSQTFHTSIQLYRASPSYPTKQLQQRIRERIFLEKDLVLDPPFFTALQHAMPEISSVYVQLKGGHYPNEITRFKFDVILQVKARSVSLTDLPWQDWQERKQTLEDVQRYLQENEPVAMAIRGVPNARLATDIQAVTLLMQNQEALKNVGDVRKALQENASTDAIDPQALLALGESLLYAVDISWSGSGTTGAFDVVFRRTAAPRTPFSAEEIVQPAAKRHYYANNPLQGTTFQNIEPQLRAYLQGKLPDYMQPYSFLILEALPLTRHGKIDRRELLSLSTRTARQHENYVAPRSALEEILADMWEQVLGVQHISSYDNFFELGGHSLLATRLVSRVQAVLQVDLSVRSLFEAPTIATFAHKVDMALHAGPLPERPPLVPVSRTSDLPLSFAQQRLWFLDQLERIGSAYNISLAVGITGPLVKAALERSFEMLVRKYESLRTTFAIKKDQLVQIINPATPFSLLLIDLTTLSGNIREAEAQRLADEDVRLAFDLTCGPLLRTTLLRLNQDEHHFLVTMHHIVSDGWSMNIFIRELITLYSAFIAGKPSPLPELSIQYADYAAWQRQWLQGDVLESQLQYWKKQLLDAPPLELPTDHPRPNIPSFRGAQHNFEVSLEVSDALKQLCRHEGVTLFMTLLAAFQILLARYSNQEDILIGTPVANRTRPELESLIGFFINTLVLRTHLSNNPTFQQVLGRVRETALDAYAHQDLPFEQLVEMQQLQRDLSRNPLFQVMFQLQDTSVEAIEDEGLEELTGLVLHPLGLAGNTVKFDITLSIQDTPQGLAGALKYSTDLFTAATIERMMAHFQVLLEGIAAHPDQHIADLPLLTQPEHKQMLFEWNDLQDVFPGALCLHQQVEAQAEQLPDAIALVYEDECLTHRELNRRANQLAYYLRTQGVRPETAVGLCVERSLELMIGVLGVLKAGAAYIPLDPTYPTERLAFMLENAQMVLLLTQDRLAHLVEGQGAQVVRLDADWYHISSEELLASDVQPDNLAYVIYTSGSTGTPKGVQVSHRAICNRILWAQKESPLYADDRVLQSASFSFDISLWELLGPLFTGARVILPRPGGQQDSAYLANLMIEQQVTVAHFVPSLLQLLLEEAHFKTNPWLRSVFCGGEGLSAELAERFYTHLPAHLYHFYGPTEASISMTSWLCVPEKGVHTIPLGRPIANMQGYILDSHLQPVPINVAGEFYIGGVGLARGYINRPDLTAERFVPHPFSSLPGARLYRTGDLVRYRSGGNLEFLGRQDMQVKIHGYRIELGEIEAVLNRHTALRESVVVAREDLPGIKELVAYIIPSQLPGPSVSALRSYLQEWLPDYMVPGIFVQMEALPLTPNGKVDRNALPAQGISRPQLEHAFVAPQTPLEHFLAAMWQEMLRIEIVGTHDSFFELGGDSIKGAIFINRLQEKFGVLIHVVALFDASNIADLALYLSKHYPQEVLRLFGAESLPNSIATLQRPHVGVNAQKVAGLRQIITPLAPRALDKTHPKNPPAIFVLSPPRSGSTLLRVMLAGHPALFAPPELELLSFNTLQERKSAFAGRNKFWLEGTIRALMEIHGCDDERAKSIMEQCEEQDLTTQQFYALMQGWLHGKTLVDKTPAYALDIEILKRAEEDFTNARYIHLLRHPFGMIRSMEEAKLDQVFFRHPHTFSSQELAELIWLISQQNIVTFLQTIPADRQYRVSFEDLVKQPQQIVEQLCDFLQLDFCATMLQPYEGQRMTDGIHTHSKMVGDLKFHTHQAIDPQVAERWKEHHTKPLLAAITWQMAEMLGYQKPAELADQEYVETIPIIPRESASATQLPLSLAQQRLWFLDQLMPGTPIYNVPLAFQIEGSLNVPALEKSFNALIQHHEMLRTTFDTVAGQPVQVIRQGMPSASTIVDLEDVPAALSTALARQCSRDEALRPFDLTHGPLIRTNLLVLGSARYVLLLTLHHIIADGWSIGILMRELISNYQAFAAGNVPSLPAQSIQYADFAIWQRAWLQGNVLEKQISYWEKHLKGVTPLDLPIDHPRPAVQSYRGKTQSFWLPARLSEELKRLSQQEDVTLFILLLAAFQTFLYRYSGQTAIAVGTPVANRNRIEIENVIGFFVNTQVLYTDLAGNPTFLQLLERVREVALGAFTHQDVPFEKLVEVLQPERDMSRSPLFQVMFSLQNTQQTIEGVEGLQITGMAAEETIAKFDLTLAMSDTGQELHYEVEYNTDLFAASTISRMMEHWQMLLEGIIAHPEEHIAALPLVSQAERQNMLVTWNNTSTPFPQEICLHELFEAQAGRSPDAIALVFEDEQLTYCELNRRANQLANYLQNMGVRPEVLVGVALPRSLEMVIGLMGVLKAGAAYVPLDPTLPQQRLRLMLMDAGITAVLTSETLAQTIMSEFAHLVQLVCLDREWSTIGLFPNDQPHLAIQGTNLVYVIYTSGSTGTPKGVAISQQNLLNYVSWCCQHYKVATGSGSVVHSSLSFDLTVTSLFAPLLIGCKVYLVPEEQGVEGLVNLLRQHNHLSLLKITPAHLDILNHELAPAELHDLAHALIIGGEALLMKSVAIWRKYAPATRLINEYGPTETAVGCCIYEVMPKDPQTGMVPIGCPVANTQLYILDEYLQPVPLGARGELYIGGAGLARGYINRADLTAERFLPDPFSSEPGLRLYRSGDIAHYQTDGSIEYLGRSDQQVKIRGYRIELGEIETVLSQHPQIHETLVLAHKAGVDNTQLVAYLVGSQAEVPTQQALYSFLRQRLPEYMLPVTFIWLEALPLTPHGKVDRQALPAPDTSTRKPPTKIVVPHKPLEEILLAIWGQILDRKEVGIDDNFFLSGGHSLLATQLISRVRTALHIDLPLRSLFEAPTFSGFARKIEEALQVGHGVKIPPLVPASRTGALPLSFEQQRLWFINELEQKSSIYNIPTAVRLQGIIDVHVLERSLAEVVRRQESLRTTFHTVDGRPIQIIHPAGSFYLRKGDLSTLTADRAEVEVQRLVQEEAQQPFDLAQGALLRTQILRLNKQEHVLLLTMHHIISDGWSMGVFVNELVTIYTAFVEARPSPLPDLPIQYADYATWQAQWVQGENLELLLNYWRHQLAGAKPLQLPFARPRSTVQSHEGAIHVFNLPQSLYKSLVSLSHHEGTTIFMTLLAAFQTLLYRHTGQDDIVVGTDSAHRTHVETEALIGFFVNLLVLRSSLRGKPSFRKLLSHVREMVLEAYTYQDLPFDVLIDKLKIKRVSTHTPLINALFVLQNVPRPNGDLPNLTLTSLTRETTTARFDLALFLSEGPEGLHGAVRYSTAVFEEDSISQLMHHFAVLLQSALEQPDVSVDALEMFNTTEKAQMEQEKLERLKDQRIKLNAAKAERINLTER